MARRASPSKHSYAPQVGDGITAPDGVWTFGGSTPNNFDGHVARSLPGYHECHELILAIADQLVPAGGRCYDLGCSTGTLTEKLAERLAARDVEIVAVDREPGMIDTAAQRLGASPSVRFVTSELERLTPEPADLAICFYTLQFTRPRERPAILERLHRALAPYGALVLFEKVLPETGQAQSVAEGVYSGYKRRQGFTDDEIAAKARSLRGVLRPLTAEDTYAMLRRAGFREIVQVFRWMSFDGVIAYA